MNFIRNIILVLASVFVSFNVHGADSGLDIMNRCSAKFKNAPSVTIGFSIIHDAGSMQGELVISKKMFRLTTPALSIWFDGTTQWTYMTDNKEVNITEPTGVELMESNPFELISSSAERFTCTRLKSSPGSDIVELTPKLKDFNIRSAKVTISKSTGWPTALVIVSDNGNTTSVAVTKVSTGPALAVSQFRFDKKAYPNAELIDLR